MMKITKIVFAIAFGVLGIACTSNTAINSSSTPAGSKPSPAATDELATGRGLYKQNCAACHREDGTGGKITIEGKTIKPDDLTSEKLRAKDDAKLAGYISNGVEDDGMPAFKDKLKEEEIKEIVKYVRSGLN